MGGRAGMLVVSSEVGVIVEVNEFCRKWMVDRCGIESAVCNKIPIV